MNLDQALNKLAVKRFRSGDFDRASFLFEDAPQAPKYKRIMKGVVTTSDEMGDVFLIVRNDGASYRHGSGCGCASDAPAIDCPSRVEYTFIDHDVFDRKGTWCAREESQWDAVEMVRHDFEIWDARRGDYKETYGEDHPYTHSDDLEIRGRLHTTD